MSSSSSPPSSQVDQLAGLHPLFTADPGQASASSSRGGGRCRFFISYAHGSPEDERLCARFASALAEENHQVFFDRKMGFGTPWAEEIERQLRECDFFLLLLSRNALGSEMVLEELERVCDRRRSEGAPAILTVRVKLEDALPYRWAAHLSSYQWRTWQDDADFGPILEAIKEVARPAADPGGAGAGTGTGAWEATVQRDILIGTRVGEYVVRRRIGSGGMGIIYEAEQPQISRKVAVKVLRPEVGATQACELAREARASGRIRHRAIVDVFGFGEIPSIGPYLVMEYLEGQSLSALLTRRGALPVPEVLWVLDEVLAGLAAAHAEGVVHLDLKPSNLFVVTASGGAQYVKILDFGLARQAQVQRCRHDTEMTSTMVGLVVGTPEYMAPEQARGLAVSGRTDLYSLGVVAFEMLTGRHPFEGASRLEIAVAHLQRPAPCPSRFKPVPPQVDSLVLRLMEKEPGRRPVDAAAVRREVKDLIRQFGSVTRIGRLDPAPGRTETAAPAPEAPQEPRPPCAQSASTTRVVQGRFRCIRVLGRGGMGTVYEVEDASSGQRLALKRLSEPSTERDRLRFRREFHTLAQLKHPAIVEAYEFGVDEEGPFYTMELLEGADLHELGLLPLDRALDVLVQTASALAFLHARRLVHRDVASRNIRFSASGQAKLIDFGILASVGATAEVAGTPPYVAPECYGGLPLDHRADLFALGALAYQLLTGQHAYPARSFEELEALWARMVPPPSAIRPRVPAAVDALVMALLSLDPARRPRSAPEVIDRLAGLAGQAAAAQAEGARAYLTSPPLVGREQELSQLKRSVEKAVRGELETVVLDSAPGMGKTRLLAEVALEAQFSGALVLRADAQQSADVPYAVVRQLLRDLFRTAPELAAQTGAAHAGTLARILPELSMQFSLAPVAPAPASPAKDRARVQVELTSWFLEVARLRPLALLLDDAHRCDEASAAVLATLAMQRQRRPLLIVLALRSNAAPHTPEPIAALRRRAGSLYLHGLELPHFQNLVRGMVGELPRLERLAAWMHRVTAGNPLHTVHLARQMVERGMLRYQGGLWQVPELLEDGEVPRALLETLSGQLGSLSPDARALGEALSVHHGELPLELCVEVSGLDTEQRVFRAMDELVDKEVLAEAGGRVRFLHGGFREALSLVLPEERRRLLHRRMGEALLAASGAGERDGEIGWHLLRGGDEARGAERLEYAGRRLYDAQSVPDCLAPLQAAVEVYARLGKPPKLLVELRYLLIVAGAIADPEAGLRQVEPLLSDCARWAGLTRVLEERRPLSGLGLAARLLGATVRWLLTPGERRGPSPLAALSMFLHASACAATTAALMHDLESLRGTIERVELLFPSPWKTFTFSRCLLSYLRSLWSFVTTNYGQVQRYTAEVLALVRCSPASWLSTRNHRMLEASMRLMAATVAVAHPDPTIHRAQLAAAEKIGLRIFEGHLALVRSQLHRVRGEEELALEHDGRAELSFLSTGVMRSAEVQRPITASMGYLVTRDVLGLRRCLEELDQVNARGGKYHGLYELLCGEYLRERGELDPALAALRRAQSLVHPEIRPVHQLILAGIAEVQIAQGLHAEARRTAEEACAVGRDFDQGFFLSWVKAERALALAEAMGGDPAAGAARLDRALQSLAEIDSPAVVGTLHEARALVALMQEDREAHGRHAAALEALYSRTHNPVLLARSQRILDAGRTPQRVPSMTQLASEVVTIAGAHEASDSPVASGDQA